MQTEQTARAPTLAPPGDKGQVSHLSFGDNSSTCLRGGLGGSRDDHARAVLGIGPGTVETWVLSLIVLFLEDHGEVAW